GNHVYPLEHDTSNTSETGVRTSASGRRWSSASDGFEPRRQHNRSNIGVARLQLPTKHLNLQCRFTTYTNPTRDAAGNSHSTSNLPIRVNPELKAQETWRHVRFEVGGDRE